ncbi:MAG: tetratricopeptide repeat protein, partial [Bdellovibrionales bacterium]
MKKIILLFYFFVSYSYADQNAEVKFFKSGIKEFQNADFENAIESFSKALEVDHRLKDYSLFYRAKSYYAMKNLELAEKDLIKIDKDPPHFKLRLEARLLLAQIYFEQKRPHFVRGLLAKIQKRVKRTEDEPQVLLALARSDRLSGIGRGCRFLIELYTRFPDYPDVRHWDADLEKNEFLGEPTNCPNSTDEFRERMRALLWAGLDQKAFAEMVLVSGRLRNEDPVISDIIRSQFHLQEGDVQKAYELLKPHAEAQINDAAFMLNFASAASRAGDSSVALGAYLHISKVHRRSKQAQRALFLASVLSYQFQDYDGAEKRFNEFIRQHPRSKLAVESRWHLAWLDYLRGDYDRALSRFQELIKKSVRQPAQLQKYQYWMAVSLIKLGRLNRAQTILTRIAQDPLRGYYAVAADSRLVELKTLKASQRPPPVVTKWAFVETMMPAMDTFYAGPEEFDEEEDYTSFVIDEEERELQDGAIEEPVEVNGEAEVTEIKTPKLAERFETSQILKSLGLVEWAKWENYEIERKTRNKDYLRTLISSYEGIEQYHRSSQIAHHRFIAERRKLGLASGNGLWSSAYPRAYRKVVEKWSSKEGVPDEFVWAIMKQESQFK